MASSILAIGLVDFVVRDWERDQDQADWVGNVVIERIQVEVVEVDL